MAATPPSKPRILVTRKLPTDVEARIAQNYQATLNSADQLYSSDELIAAAADYDGLLITSFDKFRAEVIARLPASIRMIATVSVGYDHIDIPAAKARNIAVSNTPDVLTNATADIAMLLILGAARGAHWGGRMVRNIPWQGVTMISPLGSDVSGKRLGILGMGRIGQAVARRARGFEMELHYHNRTESPAAKALGARYHARLDDMLPHCDVLSINCASTPETRGSINAARLALLPDGAILVNSARGDIIDEEALFAALKSGKPAAAGLDVYRNEPNIDRRFLELDNVFLLPHLGSATQGTRTAMGMRAADNLDAFFTGQKPRDLLTV